MRVQVRTKQVPMKRHSRGTMSSNTGSMHSRAIRPLPPCDCPLDVVQEPCIYKEEPPSQLRTCTCRLHTPGALRPAHQPPHPVPPACRRPPARRAGWCPQSGALWCGSPPRLQQGAHEKGQGHQRGGGEWTKEARNAWQACRRGGPVWLGGHGLRGERVLCTYHQTRTLPCNLSRQDRMAHACANSHNLEAKHLQRWRQRRPPTGASPSMPRGPWP